jgi:predicted metalloprotease with PDZ domain
VAELVDWGTPAFLSGLEEDDVVVAVDGKRFHGFTSRKPGESVVLTVKRPTGKVVSLKLTFGEDPALQAILVERTGGTLRPEQKAFRDSWLGSRQSRAR